MRQPKLKRNASAELISLGICL